jgi:AAA+ ATPase superfamily predicted ATPase
MPYEAFCLACKLRPADPAAFERFALVGGIPHYWEFARSRRSLLDTADALYFGFAPLLDEEPARILRDEGIAGINALSVLEAIGRGAAKPSEIAARLGTSQTNLSRLFQQLLDVSLLERELPYGESLRSTKRVLYRIKDPALRFWFQVFSPHRSRWRSYSEAEKLRYLHQHAATVFEDYCRQRVATAARHWEGDVEFDLVYPAPSDPSTLVVAEVKWKRLTAKERAGVTADLEQRWQRSKLRLRYKKVRFVVLDASVLGT